MSGYSGTPLAKKLGIKAGAEVGVLAGPDDLSERLEPLPAGATVVQQPQHPCDVLIVFAEVIRTSQRVSTGSVGLLPRDGGSGWPGPSGAQESQQTWTSKPFNGSGSIPVWSTTRCAP